MSAPSPKRRRVEIPHRVKRELARKKCDQPKMTLSDLQVFAKVTFALDIGRSTLSDIVKHKERWLEVTEEDCGSRKRSVKHKELEDALTLWFKHARKQGLLINDEFLITKARQLGENLEIKDLQYSRGADEMPDAFVRIQYKIDKLKAKWKNADKSDEKFNEWGFSVIIRGHQKGELNGQAYHPYIKKLPYEIIPQLCYITAEDNFCFVWLKKKVEAQSWEWEIVNDKLETADES